MKGMGSTIVTEMNVILKNIIKRKYFYQIKGLTNDNTLLEMKNNNNKGLTV